MKKYRVKIDCPSYKKGEILESNDGLVKWESGYYYNASNYPEIFEEIKEPRFITVDGVETFDGDNYYIVDYNWNPKTCTTDGMDNYVLSFNRFSSLESANIFIEENRPKYSKTELINIINSKFSNLYAKEIKTLLELI